jgi:hypothetical protein
MSGRKVALWAGVSLCAWTLLQACENGDERFSVDSDRDGWPRELDCDDENPKIFPSADDVPGDGIDQDCSGRDAGENGLGGEPFSPGGAGNGSGTATGSGGTDEAGGANAGGLDSDGDGVKPPIDCDDTDATVHPGAFDSPWDDVDQDCSGGDSHDRDGDGFDGGTNGPDCDDTRNEVFPGAVEIVNNRVDENCDGSDLLSEPTFMASIGQDAVVVAAPDIAPLEDGAHSELLVVWIDARRGDARDVIAQRLALDGKPLGPEMPVSDADPDTKSEVRIFAREGGFLVTWITPEGGWARQLGPTGTPVGVALGIAEPDATGLTAAFGGAGLNGGGTWGFVWQNPLADPGQQASFRSMTLDEVRSEVVRLGASDANVHHVALAGTDEGFFPIWEGDFETTRGIVATRLDRLGETIEDSWLLREGPVGEPTLIPVSTGYALIFRAPDNVGHIAGAFLDEDFGLFSDVTSRLSSDVGLQFGFRLVDSKSGLVALWNDGRHLFDTPAVEAVYGQYFTRDEAQPRRNWGTDRAIFAGADSELGGATVQNDNLIVALRSGSSIGLMVQPLDP